MFFSDTGTSFLFTLETESGNQYLSLGRPDPWWSFANAPLPERPTVPRWEPYTGEGVDERIGRLYNLHTLGNAGTETRDRRLGADTIDWQAQVWSNLRMVDPCVARGSCPAG